MEKSGNFFLLNDKCGVCYEEIQKEEKERSMMPCGHLFCTNCWFEYFKSKILEARVEPIKCIGYGCDKYISDEYILLIISVDNNLVNKYIRMRKRLEILTSR